MAGAFAVAGVAGGHLAWVAGMAWSRRRPRLDLGAGYKVHIEHGTVSITMTLTAPGCPIHDAMTAWVQRADAAPRRQ